jgi:hypothetical protein
MHIPPQLHMDPCHGLNVVDSAHITQELVVVLRSEQAAEEPTRSSSQALGVELLRSEPQTSVERANQPGVRERWVGDR